LIQVFPITARAMDTAYPERQCAWCFHPRNSAECQFSANHAFHFVEYFAPHPTPIFTTRVELVHEHRDPELFCLDPGVGPQGDPDALPAEYEIVVYVAPKSDLSIPDNIILGDN
jgi:hypothetical protein